MVKTEAERRILDSGVRHDPPVAVMEALHRHDPALELLWNEDDNRWEFYRLKEKGPTRRQDVLHWQMSCPFSGLDIQPSIINWLRKYDTSDHGRKGPDRLRTEWGLNLKEYLAHPEKMKEKRQKDFVGQYSEVYNRYAVARTQIAVPKVVGYDPANGKNIYAVKKPPKVLPNPKSNKIITDV